VSGVVVTSDEMARRLVERTRLAQGLPVKIEDADVIEAVTTLVQLGGADATVEEPRER
jgi:hypothetical protein